jgi:hypothetical protein
MPDPWKDVGRDPAQEDPMHRPTRRDRVRAEIERNRRGEYMVPTWVLALALGLFLAGWIALIVLN